MDCDGDSQVSCGHGSCLALKEAALTFHSNRPSLPCLLQKRGLKFGKSGELALFGAFRTRGTGPPSRRSEPDSDLDPKHRAVVELRQFRTCRELSDKRLLALHLKNTAEQWAPVTFLSPEELSSYPEADALFFLKHAHRERNEGVSVHLGIEACRKAWQSLPPQDQPVFLAQQEVPDLLLDGQGRKITLRIYLLLLFVEMDGDSTALALARRNFICRSHPLQYDAADPNPGRHVHSTLDTFKDVDGFSSASWHHSDAIWPEVRAKALHAKEWDVVAEWTSPSEYRRSLEESICALDMFALPLGMVRSSMSLRRSTCNSQCFAPRQVHPKLKLKTWQDSSQHVANSLEHLSTVIWTMAGHPKSGGALGPWCGHGVAMVWPWCGHGWPCLRLDIQDDQDRAKIALMGYKDETVDKPRGTKNRKNRASSPPPAEAVTTVVGLDSRSSRSRSSPLTMPPIMTASQPHSRTEYGIVDRHVLTVPIP
eukprot:Skav208469  [mRNA]  locus=scaffold1104:270273:279697:+ [translate_table: standard]